MYSTIVGPFTDIISFNSHHYYYICFTRQKTSKDGVCGLAQLIQHYQIPEGQDNLRHLLSESLGAFFLHLSVLSPHYFALFYFFYFVHMHKCVVCIHKCIWLHAVLCLCSDVRGGCEVSYSILSTLIL